MKNLVFIFVSISQILLSQNLEYFIGANRNSFFDYEVDKGHFQSEYKSKYGYCIGLSKKAMNSGKSNFRYSIQLEMYAREFNVSKGGNGGYESVFGDVQRYNLSGTFYPINLMIKNKLDLSLGLEGSYKLLETNIGYNYSFLMGQYESKINFKNDKELSNKFGLGAKVRLAYPIKISEAISIVPQYLYYLGIINEFDKGPHETKSMRYYIGIGILKIVKF